jgi:hypothetical protein
MLTLAARSAWSALLAAWRLLAVEPHFGDVAQVPHWLLGGGSL